MTEVRLQERLREVFVPEEREAEERGWRVVHGAFEARHPVHVRPRLNRLAIALGRGPADRRHRADPGRRQDRRPGPRRGRARPRQRPAGAHLAAGAGRLLVTSAEGPWIVDEDGSQRLLGAYQDAAWSPSGMFAAVTRGRQLTAVDPVGNGALVAGGAAPGAATPPGRHRASASRTRAAARCASWPATERVTACSSTASPPSRPPGGRSASPCPPGQVAIGPKTNVLAYADRRGRVTVRDVDAGRVLWRSHRYSLPIRELEWSADRKRLLVRTAWFVDFLDARGRATSRVTWPTLGASMSPDSSEPPSSGGPRTAAATWSSPAATAAARRGASSPGRGGSRTRPGRPTANGCWWRGATPTSGSSSVPRGPSGSTPSPTSPASSPPAPPAGRPSRGSAAGAARADARGRLSPTPRSPRPALVVGADPLDLGGVPRPVGGVLGALIWRRISSRSRRVNSHGSCRRLDPVDAGAVQPQDLRLSLAGQLRVAVALLELAR